MYPNFNQLPLAEQIDIIVGLTKGAIHTFTYRKQVVLAKKYEGIVLETESVIQGRCNLTYGENLALVREARENGAQEGELKGFHAVIPNVLYENDKTGRKAFRVFPFNGGKHSKRYFLNGVEKTFEDLLAMGLPKSSLVSNGGTPAVLALYAENIVCIA